MEKNSESLLLIGASICQPVKCNSRGCQMKRTSALYATRGDKDKHQHQKLKMEKRSSKDKCLWFCEELAMWCGCFGNLPSVHIRSRASSNHFKIIEKWFPFDPRNKCCRSLLACIHSTVNICRKVEIFGWNFVRSVHHFVTPELPTGRGLSLILFLTPGVKTPHHSQLPHHLNYFLSKKKKLTKRAPIMWSSRQSCPYCDLNKAIANRAHPTLELSNSVVAKRKKSCIFLKKESKRKYFIPIFKTKQISSLFFFSIQQNLISHHILDMGLLLFLCLGIIAFFCTSPTRYMCIYRVIFSLFFLTWSCFLIFFYCDPSLSPPLSLSKCLDLVLCWQTIFVTDGGERGEKKSGFWRYCAQTWINGSFTTKRKKRELGI